MFSPHCNTSLWCFLLPGMITASYTIQTPQFFECGPLSGDASEHVVPGAALPLMLTYSPQAPSLPDLLDPRTTGCPEACHPSWLQDIHFPLKPSLQTWLWHTTFDIFLTRQSMKRHCWKKPCPPPKAWTGQSWERAQMTFITLIMPLETPNSTLPLNILTNKQYNVIRRALSLEDNWDAARLCHVVPRQPWVSHFTSWFSSVKQTGKWGTVRWSLRCLQTWMT